MPVGELTLFFFFSSKIFSNYYSSYYVISSCNNSYTRTNDSVVTCTSRSAVMPFCQWLRSNRESCKLQILCEAKDRDMRTWAIYRVEAPDTFPPFHPNPLLPSAAASAKAGRLEERIASSLSLLIQVIFTSNHASASASEQPSVQTASFSIC